MYKVPDHLSLCCWVLDDGSASSIGCSLGSTNKHSLKLIEASNSIRQWNLRRKILNWKIMTKNSMAMAETG